MYAWEHEIRPSDILSQSSFENVVRYMMATGGSTNSLLHIPALARQADFDITPETFDAISREVPLLSTIYPNHPTYTMEAVWQFCTATSAPTAPLSSSAPWTPPHGSSAVLPSATTRRTTHGTPF